MAMLLLSHLKEVKNDTRTFVVHTSSYAETSASLFEFIPHGLQ